MKNFKTIDKSKIKTWLVTGASSGVGYELCKQLLERGYNVIAAARRISDFEHKNALCISCDVSNPDSIQNAIKKGIERFGKIDVVSNNAGISTSVIFEEETLERMKNVMETNFFGTYNVIQSILPHFRKNNNGTIINNTSQSGLAPRKYGSAYCSSKHAAEGLTSVLWLETKNFCRVIAVELGYFPGTGIGKGTSTGSKKTTIPEYETIKGYWAPIKYNFANVLSKAVSYIINETEKEFPRRRIILGHDAQTKVHFEIESLKEDLKYAKRNFTYCSPEKKIKNYTAYLNYFKYKFLKNIVWGETRKRYKNKQKIFLKKSKT